MHRLNVSNATELAFQAPGAHSFACYPEKQRGTDDYSVTSKIFQNVQKMRCHASFQDTLPPPKMTTHLARNYCECLRATAQENTSHIHLRAPPGLVVGYLYLWRHGFWGILSKDRKKVGLVGDQKVCGASTAFNSCSQLSRYQGMWVTYSRLL